MYEIVGYRYVDMNTTEGGKGLFLLHPQLRDPGRSLRRRSDQGFLFFRQVPGLQAGSQSEI